MFCINFCYSVVQKPDHMLSTNPKTMQWPTDYGVYYTTLDDLRSAVFYFIDEP